MHMHHTCTKCLTWRWATVVGSCGRGHLGGWSNKMTWGRNSGTASLKLFQRDNCFSFCVCCCLCFGGVLACLLVFWDLVSGQVDLFSPQRKLASSSWTSHLYLRSARITGVCFHIQLRESLGIWLSLAPESGSASPSSESRCRAYQRFLWVQISSL